MSILNTDVLLIFPPFAHWNYREIYPSLPVVASALKQYGYSVEQLDLNNEYIDWYLNSEQHYKKIEKAKKIVGDYERSESLTKSEYDNYIYLNKYISVNKLLSRTEEPTKGIVRKIMSHEIPEFMCSVNRNDVLNNNKYNKFHSKIFDKFIDHILSKKKPRNLKLVGMSIPMPTQIMPAIYFANEIKKKWNNVPVVFGGPQCSFFEDDIKHKVICDANLEGLVCGEGEESVVVLMDMYKENNVLYDRVPNFYYSKNKKLYKSKAGLIKDINTFKKPYYKKSLIKRWHVNELSVVTSRRCSWGKCAYCDFQSYYKSRQVRDPKLVVNDMELMVKEYGVNRFNLACDTIEPEWIKVFSEEIIRKKIKVFWKTFMKVNLKYTESLFEQMKKSGAYDLGIGLDSLDDNVLKLMRKGYDCKEATEFIGRMTRANLKFTMLMIANLPSTTYQSALNQYEYISNLLTKKLLNCDGSYPDCEIGCGRYQLLSGSPIGRNPKKYGLSEKGFVPEQDDYCFYSYNELQYIELGGMTEKQCSKIISLYSTLNKELMKKKSIESNLLMAEVIKKNAMLHIWYKIIPIKILKYKILNHRYKCVSGDVPAIFIDNGLDGEISEIEGEYSVMAHDILEILPASYETAKRCFEGKYKDKKNIYDSIISEMLISGLIIPDIGNL